MSYYYPGDLKPELELYPQFKERLYCRGFLLTDEEIKNLNEYPFYGNWRDYMITGNGSCYHVYVHKDNNCYCYSKDDYVMFLVGHAYDPFDMVIDENDILRKLEQALEMGEDAFWQEESKLTGVFVTGFLNNGKLVYSTDCAGMQLVYHGIVDNRIFITSHSKLVADIKGLEQTEYIKRLTTSKLWPLWGTWLPGDISPYAELIRLNPNCKGVFSEKSKTVSVERYYPKTVISETKTEEEFRSTIQELGRIMSNTMKCIAAKWPDKKISISVTGGKDSMTTLACSREIYDKFSFFSYISNSDESVDAYAAKDILGHLGLKHELIEIPEDCPEYNGIETFKKVMQCNNGCIGANKLNDIKKRMFFCCHPPCDIEVKSWVNETGRGWEYNKFNKKRFPKYPYPGYWRAMHKAYINPWLIRETDKIFSDYLKKYYSKEVFDRLSWLELYFWEFACNASEGCFLTSEHRVSYEITIPFNNRRYIELMMTVPVEKRKAEGIPNALIQYMEPRITETGISVHDVSHTNFRANAMRIYLEIFSKIRF